MSGVMLGNILLGSLVLVILVLGLASLVMLARSFLLPSRPATLTINGTSELKARTGQKLLSALLEGGVLVPSACAGAGTCGLCRVEIPDGGPAPLPVEAARLSREDLKSGVHLACQVTLRGDMAVRVADDLLAAEAIACKVASVRALTPLIREIVLSVPDGHDLDLFAGAFIQITTPAFRLHFSQIDVPDAHTTVWEPLRNLVAHSDEPVTRAYSIANRPSDTQAGQIVLNIRLALPPPSVPDAPPGLVSSWLFALKPGDSVSVAGPFGTFRTQTSDSEMVFLGGGVGMAPLRAMLFDMLERQNSKRKISFWYGARSEQDMLYVAELDALAAAHENFDWTQVLSEPDLEGSWDGPQGFVHQAVFERYLRDHPAPEDCEYYLCGPPMMIAAVMTMLESLGVEPDHIFNDDFGV